MDEGERPKRLAGGPVLVAALLLMLAGVAGLWFTLEHRETEAATTRTELVAEQAALRLQDFLRSRLLVLEVVRREQLLDAFPTRAAFELLVANLQLEFTGFHAVNWMDAEGVIRWTCPAETNAAAEGLNVFDHPVAGPVLREVAATRRPALTPPLDLFQGGRAFTCYFPVVAEDDTLRGYVNGVFLLEHMVVAALSRGVLDDYELLLRDGDQVLFGDGERFARAATERVEGEAQLTLLEHHWTLGLVPRPPLFAVTSSSLLPFVLWGGVALALAITFVLWLILQRQRQRQAALHERRHLETRLHQAQKMEALGQLAGGVAHDFNNLMTAVLGNVELINSQGALGQAQRESLQEVALAAHRASALTAQLLAFSRHQMVQPHPLDLNHEVETLRAMLSRLVREDVTLRLDLDPGVARVLLDPTQLGQVLMNLVVNATDAMPAGGQITILTRNQATGPAGDGPHVVLSVRDEGMGMDAETRRRAVEPFFSTKGLGHGTGLGLSTVYGIVTGSGGQLVLHSAPERGTSVETWWPVCTEPPDAGSPTPLGNAGTAIDRRTLEGASRRVLVVEDEPAVRKVAVTLLRRAGFEVVEAEDGVSALALASATCFDAVVTDAVMPRMGGIELARHLRQLDPQVRIVLCTGYAAPSDPAELQALGAVTVTKPYSVDDLLLAVERPAVST